MDEIIFAYGSNMCRGRLRDRGVAPTDAGRVAQLDGYALRFDKRSTDGSSKANVEPRAGSVVWGVLYSLSSQGLARLNADEVGYVPRQLTVIRDGRPVNAWVHVADESERRPGLLPYSWYKRFIVEGARSHGLPADYMAILETIEAAEDHNQARDRRRRATECNT